jgi:hypothetical protein
VIFVGRYGVRWHCAPLVEQVAPIGGLFRGKVEVQFVGDEMGLFSALGMVVEIDGCCKPWVY